MKDRRQESAVELDENEAIDKAKSGDPEGHERLYRLNKRRVYSLCLRYAGNASDAEDLTQEVFLQVYRKIGGFRGEAKFASWLYRVAMNVAMMHLRKRRTGVVSLETAVRGATPAPRPSIASSPLERLAILRALASLSKGRRSVVVLHDIEGLTHVEIGRTLGLNISTSKSKLREAHRKLRDMLACR
jgi:RNA polymerase sigma-70 factor, ECF subfamily